jgi:hypothetical protein
VGAAGTFAELLCLYAAYLRSLAPTVLVHEAYLKLIDQRRVHCQNRSPFDSIAGHVMRRILVDHGRAHAAAKRGGNARIPLDDVDVGVAHCDVDALALDAALEKLASVDRRQSELVELRFFVGVTVLRSRGRARCGAHHREARLAARAGVVVPGAARTAIMGVSSSWERIRALFHAALDQPADARAAFLSNGP